MCPTIIILISNWPQTGKFSQPLQAGKTVAFDFSHHGHSLVTLYVQFLCSDWSKFGRWVHAENLCSVLNLVYFDSWSWQSFVSTCDVFNCLFLLHVQNEIQLLSGVFCYSWLACFLSFWHYKSLVLLFKGIKGNGPDYISDLFEPRILRYHPIIIDIITILSLTRLRICGISFLLILRDRLSWANVVSI